MKLIFAVFLTIPILGCAVNLDTDEAKYLTKCISIAEPLVYKPDHIFPLTVPAIRTVCRMWDEFRICVKNYTQEFMQESEGNQFKDAIQPSMKSIEQLCSENKQYLDDYFEYAPCLKNVTFNENHCGQQYRYMADLVQGNLAPSNLLCCSHWKFRSCVLREIPRVCSTAKPFVLSLMDRSFDLLLQNCKYYNPTTNDCPGSSDYDRDQNPIDNRSEERPIPGSELFGNNDLGSNGFGSNLAQAESRPATSSGGSTKFTWTPPTQSSSTSRDDRWNLNGDGVHGNKIDGPQPFVDKAGSSADYNKISLISIFVVFSFAILF